MLVTIDRLDAHGGEVAARALGNALIRDRALEDDNVRLAFELAVPCVVEGLHEFGAGLDRQHRMMQQHLWHRGDDAQQEALNAWICRTGDGDGAPVAAHPRQPIHVDVLERPEREPFGGDLGLRGLGRGLGRFDRAACRFRRHASIPLGSSTDSRQRIADQHVEHARSARLGLQEHHVLGPVEHFPNDCGLLPV